MITQKCPGPGTGCGRKEGCFMNEPNLNHIDDYHTLQGEKRRVVWAVVVACLIVGGIFAGAKYFYDGVSDETPTVKIGKVPYK